MPDPLVTEILQDWERLDGDRGTWKSHCQSVALYLDPDRADFTGEHTAGQKRMQRVFDASPLFAHEIGAAGLHAMFTSDTLPWFSTVPEDERLASDPDVKGYFEAMDAADFATFNNPELNFASQSHQVYLDTLAYGGACMGLLDGRNGALFTNRHLAEICFAENEEDRVDQTSRRWRWTAKQAFDQWGPAAGEKVMKAIADNKLAERFWFHHRVKPRAMANRDPQSAEAKNKPFESVYVAEADMIVIRNGGFDTFPYLCPRLSKRAPQDVMGRGRGYMMLPDVQMINALARIVIRSAEKIVDPALMAPDDGFVVPIRQAPSSVNYYRAGLRPTDRIQALDTHGNVPVGVDLIARLEAKIGKGFFNDLLTTPTDPTDPASAGKGVTATFTDKLSREQMRILSPINARLNAEWAAPLVLRIRQMNFANSVLRRFGPGSPYPPPPANFVPGIRWRAHFKSPVALAQRAAELSAVDQLWQRQLLLRQIDPDSEIILDAEATMRLEGRDLNVPIGILKSPRVLAAERALKQQRLQQQHDAEVAQGQSGAIANLAGAHAAVAGPAQQGLRSAA